MKYIFGFVVLASLGMLAIAGCNSDTSGTPNKAVGEGGEHDHGGEAHSHDDDQKAATDATTDMEKMKEELAKLSPEDAASAEKQHMCPVSGEMLGTMGPPIKVAVNDQEVWICCEGCRKDLLENPDEYLAKLAK